MVAEKRDREKEKEKERSKDAANNDVENICDLCISPSKMVKKLVLEW